MLTEQKNPRSVGLDTLDVMQVLQVMNEEDQTVALSVQQALPQIASAIEAIVPRLQAGGRLLYVGAGTSGRNGVLDAVECVPTFGTPPTLVQALIAGGESAFVRSVEGAEDDVQAGANDLRGRSLTAGDVVVGIAASGRTPYVLGALAYAQSLGTMTVGISCNQPAPLLDSADFPIAVITGPEVLSGSTRLKAGTAQKLVLNMISTVAMVKLGKVYGNLMVDVQITNEKLQQRAERILMELTDLPEAEASHLLKQAENNIKLAVVMHHQGLALDEARQRLQDANGHLRVIIG
ncbi:MAG: N-acetylmuramic acid 6-phosphate etherase [Anaerolineae bacterium]